MKIPKILKIGGHIYKIIFKNTARKEQKRHCGYENSEWCEIVLDTDLSTQTQETTLLHEVLEAINYKNELGLNHKQIMSLEHNLYQVLKDNKFLT